MTAVKGKASGTTLPSAPARAKQAGQRKAGTDLQQGDKRDSGSGATGQAKNRPQLVRYAGSGITPRPAAKVDTQAVGSRGTILEQEPAHDIEPDTWFEGWFDRHMFAMSICFIALLALVVGAGLGQWLT